MMETTTRRTHLKRLATWGASAAIAPFATHLRAEPSYPTKPIFIKVAFPAGGPADAAIRAASAVMQQNLKQPVLADNQPGANGSIAAMAVLRAPTDGYTLLGTTGTDFIVAPMTIASAQYRPDSFRLAGVTGWSDFALVSTHAKRFATIDQLVAYARTPGNPQLSIAHWGSGSAPHIVGADFQRRAGVRFLEVPYKGAGPAMINVVGGQVDLTFIPFSGPVVGMVQSGKLMVVGLATAKRHPLAPQVPTISESRSVPNFEYSQWSGVIAPPKTPDNIIRALNAAVNQWLVSPENAERVAVSFQRRIYPMTLTQADALLKSEYEKFTRVVRELKLEPK